MSLWTIFIRLNFEIEHLFVILDRRTGQQAFCTLTTYLAFFAKSASLFFPPSSSSSSFFFGSDRRSGGQADRQTYEYSCTDRPTDGRTERQLRLDLYLENWFHSIWQITAIDKKIAAAAAAAAAAEAAAAAAAWARWSVVLRTSDHLRGSKFFTPLSCYMATYS